MQERKNVPNRIIVAISFIGIKNNIANIAIKTSHRKRIV